MTRRPESAHRTAATRIGVPYALYREMMADGKKWCTYCESFKLRSLFSKNATRSDGKDHICKECRRWANSLRDARRKRLLVDTRPRCETCGQVLRKKAGPAPSYEPARRIRMASAAHSPDGMP